MNRRSARALLMAFLVAPPAAAMDAVVARSGNATITARELRLVLSSLPDAERSRLDASPAAMADLLRSMLLQDLLFAAAHTAGIDRQPDVALQAARASEGSVVRSYLERQIPSLPAPDAARIAAAYAANKNHFMQPRRFHLAQIFLSAAQQPALQALAHQLADDPAGFAAAARTHSQDRRSAAAGGDLGWLAQDDLAEPIRSAVAGMPVGGVSAPLQTVDGWHLIKLIDTRPAAPAPLNAVRMTLVQALVAEDRAAAMRRYVADAAQRNAMQIDPAQLRRAQERPQAP